jgi:hypothetical protein
VSDWISNEDSNDFLSLWFNQQDLVFYSHDTTLCLRLTPTYVDLIYIQIGSGGPELMNAIIYLFKQLITQPKAQSSTLFWEN